MEKDIFCRINDGEMPSSVVYENDKLKVIMDKFPVSPGHMLVIPKRHITDALDIDDETFIELNEIIKKMIKKCYEILNADGVEIVQNNGICQEIKHYHVHIIPKYKNKINLNNEEIYEKLIRSK